jgi:hypothetical protein
MCFVWISEQTAVINLHNFNWLVFVTEMVFVYYAVRTEYLPVILIYYRLWWIKWTVLSWRRLNWTDLSSLFSRFSFAVVVFWVWVSGFDSRMQDTHSYSPDTAWSALIVCALRLVSLSSLWLSSDAVGHGSRADACLSRWVGLRVTTYQHFAVQIVVNL